MDTDSFSIVTRVLYELVSKDGSRKAFNSKEDLMKEISLRLDRLDQQDIAAPSVPKKRTLDEVLGVKTSVEKLNALTRPIKWHDGFKDVFSEPSLSTSHKNSLYRYARNPETKAWEFVILNGKMSAIHALGSPFRAKDKFYQFAETLQLGRKTNKNDQILYKWSGEVKKAMFDILVHLGYVSRQNAFDIRGHHTVTYVKIKDLKSEEEVVNSYDREVATPPLQR